MGPAAAAAAVMTGFEVDAMVLVAAGLGPALLMSVSGQSSTRLIALELAGATTTAIFLLMAQISGSSYELIVPLALVPLSFTGALVFTRLLALRRDR